jgi:hypothetical protein
MRWQRRIWALSAIALFLPLNCVAQLSKPGADTANSGYQFKVGVLPFIDTTGTLEDKGTVIARLLQSELTHTSDLEVRFIKPAEDSGSDIDSDAAVKLAREHKNDVVILATIISAQVEESDHSAQGPTVFGQTLGGSSHSAKASVELQADLYSSTTGKKIDSFRVTGEEHVNKVSGSADTSLGELGNSGQTPSSPLGKAMQKAVHNLASRIAADEPKMLRYHPAEDAGSSEQKSDN